MNYPQILPTYSLATTLHDLQKRYKHRFYKGLPIYNVVAMLCDNCYMLILYCVRKLLQGYTNDKKLYMHNIVDM